MALCDFHIIPIIRDSSVVVGYYKTWLTTDKNVPYIDIILFGGIWYLIAYGYQDQETKIMMIYMYIYIFVIKQQLDGLDA